MDLAGHFAARRSVIRAKAIFYSLTLNMDLTNLIAVCSICCKKQRGINTKNNTRDVKLRSLYEVHLPVPTAPAVAAAKFAIPYSAKQRSFLPSSSYESNFI